MKKVKKNTKEKKKQRNGFYFLKRQKINKQTDKVSYRFKKFTFNRKVKIDLFRSYKGLKRRKKSIRKG